MKRFLTIGAAALLGLCASAADVRAAGDGEFAKAQAALKAKAPEAYAKIEKLAATDLNAALREFRKLAREQKIQLPRPTFSLGDRGRRVFPGDDRAERYPRGDRGGRPGMSGGRSGNPLAALIAESQIRAKFPTEFAEAAGQLAAAENRMRELAAKAHVEYPRNFSSQLRVLREKAPRRFAEIEAKAADSPREAMRELMALADEEKIELALPVRGGRGGRGGRADAAEHRPEPRKVSHPPLRKLRETFPDEMKRYEQLRRNDPSAAAKLLRELAAKLETERSARRRK